VEQEAAAQIAELMSRTNRRIRRAAGQELRPIGVTPSQLRALRTLSQGPMRVSALAQRLDIVPRSATSVVDGLEEAGLVAREPDPDDRRATLVVVTDAGRQVLAELRARRQAGMAELLSRLTPDEQAELVRLLTLLAGPTEG
jgi:DNA-binding MarR family transcriptional regulator